ncbi:unnamed protein product, partial [Lymnaea stagnalis]
MFSKVGSDKTKFLEHIKAARDERAQDREKEVATVRIQSSVRGYFSRRRLKKAIYEEIDTFLNAPPPESDAEYKPTLKP